MSTTIQVPMNEEQRIALEDCFIEIPNMDARKFIFDNIKMACGDSKRSIRNKITLGLCRLFLCLFVFLIEFLIEY